MPSHFDVIIAGGGAIGSACAYFLASNPAFDGTLAVIEPDARYTHAASALSASSIRQQFSSAVNIAISQFGIAFLRAVPDLLDKDGERPDIGLVESTYLYLSTPAGLGSLRKNVQTQSRCGVPVQLCQPATLNQKFPWLNTADLAAGAVTESGEGWFDGYQLLMVLRRKARDLGVPYINSRVEGLVRGKNQRIDAITLADGSRFSCGFFVNATGTHARDLAAQVGIEIPVFPRKRCVFAFDSGVALPDCPLVVDPGGLWFRPEGRQFICGLPPEPDPDVAVDDFVVNHDLFENRIWPLLANRVPGFEAVRVTNAWAGHYDYNVVDQNAIIGPHPVVTNFFLANGFSGHGLQQAPAAGRGLSEQILFGEYRSLDLSPLSFERILRNEPLLELNVI